MPNWKAAPFLAYEEPDGTRQAAVFQIERNGYVRASVYSRKYKRPLGSDLGLHDPRNFIYDIDMKFKADTGARIPDDTINGKTAKPIPGKLVVSAEDLFSEHFDPVTREVRVVILDSFDHRDLLAGGGEKPDELVKQRIVLDVEPGKVAVVSVEPG